MWRPAFYMFFADLFLVKKIHSLGTVLLSFGFVAKNKLANINY